MHVFRSLFIGTFCLLFMITAQAQEAAAAGAINDIMKKHQLAGVSVAVVHKSKIIYSEAFGKRDLSSGEPVEESDLFRIASISKSFTATALMQLAEAGKLSLDDDFSDLVGFRVRNPKFPEKVITLRMILSHTSSVNDSQGYFNLDVINPENNADFSKCYNDYEPGTDYQYCNLNFNMAGAVIERVSGERFDRNINKHILQPLKLYGGYNVDELDSSRFVTLYTYDGDSGVFVPSPQAYASRKEIIDDYKMGYTTPVFSPTGGMKLSANHLAIYMLMHMNKGKYKNQRIISRKSAKTMQTPVAMKEGYGLALHESTNHLDNIKLMGHTGSAYGLFSAMFFHPKDKYGIVVMISGGNPAKGSSMRAPVKEIMQALYDHLIVK